MRTILVSALPAFGILAVAQGTWAVLLIANLRGGAALPWCVPAMALLLFAFWRILMRRPDLLRVYRVPGRRFAFALAAGAFTIAALSGLWIVLSQLVHVAPNALPNTAKYSFSVLLPVAVMAALVSPLSEEAAFRGYCQSLLERRFPATAAIAVSSILFMLAHLTQGPFATKLLVYLLFGIAMGTMAYLTQSILPGIVVHIAADLTFFLLVWPFDATRTLVWNGGADVWFWVHVAQVMLCMPLAVVSFVALRNVRDAENAEYACKPDSVPPRKQGGDDHLSGLRVTT